MCIVVSSISKADTDEKIGEFWDAHDFTDFDTPDLPDVEFEVTFMLPDDVNLPESELLQRLNRYRRIDREMAEKYQMSFAEFRERDLIE